MKGLSAANYLTGVLTMATTATAWSDSGVHHTVLPTEFPTATSRDPWQCVTENLTQYFDVPLPTGALLTALVSYADELIETCTITGVDKLYGCYPEKEAWCPFATAVAPDLLPDYSSYGSAASSWWAAHSSKAVSLAQMCPYGWYNAQYAFAGGPTWFNDTIIFAACYDEETGGTITIDNGGAVAPTTTATPPLVGAAETGAPAATATLTGDNGVVGRAQDVKMWLVAGTGLVVAAVNFV